MGTEVATKLQEAEDAWQNLVTDTRFDFTTKTLFEAAEEQARGMNGTVVETVHLAIALAQSSDEGIRQQVQRVMGWQDDEDAGADIERFAYARRRDQKPRQAPLATTPGVLDWTQAAQSLSGNATFTPHHFADALVGSNGLFAIEGTLVQLRRENRTEV